MNRPILLSWAISVSCMLQPLRANETAFSHAPDPLAVQRFEKGYRYPQAGWIVLHVEGEPYERGVQHGRLLAAEIARYVRCFAHQQSAKAPEDGWRATRTLVNALFLRRFDKEYLEEMKGIADGAAAVGAKFDNRPIDLLDIVAVNCWAEIETLDGALEATPTGFEGKRFPAEQPKKMPEPPMGHCSAFAATGPATADGKIVFGHITMFGLAAANHFNVWLDLKPTSGQRVVMQTFPGGIQSGMDYYMNGAGLLVAETTIRQTRFNKDGMALASRIRKALQYSETIDQVATNLTTDNNGLYANEWLLGDTKTNEIAMLQLGTGKFKLSRSSKSEWYGGTEGFYWGCNNTKDLALRLETLPGTNDRPSNLVWRPSDRDKVWQRLYQQHKGKIDAKFARLAFTTPPLAAYHSLDAKYTTTDLAKELKSHALFGPPLGLTWVPTDEEKKNYPEIRALVSNPWTVLTVNGPPVRTSRFPNLRLVDLPNTLDETAKSTSYSNEPVHSIPAWRGTILPKTDGDVWLAMAFAEYERIVALEQALLKRSADGTLSDADRDRMAVEMNSYRIEFTEPGDQKRGLKPVTLAKIKRVDGDDRWYRQAVGKGVWVLHELRAMVTPHVFDPAMDSFGLKHAGKEVSTDDFRIHMEMECKQQLKSFMDYWVHGDRLPSVSVGQVKSALIEEKNRYRVTGAVTREVPFRERTPVTVRTRAGSVTRDIAFHGNTAQFDIQCSDPPLTVVIDQFNTALKASGPAVTLQSFRKDLQQTLICYGTGDDEAGNRDAAFELQRALRASGSNVTIPVKADRDIDEADLVNHLIVVGGREKSRLGHVIVEVCPVRDGKTLEVRDEAYANANTAIVYAIQGHYDFGKSVVVISGLSAAATRQAAIRFASATNRAANVCIMSDAIETARALVVTPSCERQVTAPTGK